MNERAYADVLRGRGHARSVFCAPALTRTVVIFLLLHRSIDGSVDLPHHAPAVMGLAHTKTGPEHPRSMPNRMRDRCCVAAAVGSRLMSWAAAFLSIVGIYKNTALILVNYYLNL